MSNDVVVSQKTTLENFKAPTRITPTYLVSFDFIEKGKTKQLFIAVKYDDTAAHTAKLVGFFSEHGEDEIAARYDEIIKTADIAKFQEIFVPWTKIVKIRNLIYRHKTQQSK